MEVAILFSMVIGMMLIGVPIAVSLGLSSIIFLMMFGHDASLASVAQTLFSAFEGHYTLLAIPFFILASVFMSTGGVANRIIRFAIAVVGSFRGGLAIASVFACMLFAALSGSSPATVVAIGSIVIAGMISVGYTREFAAGVICNAGTLGILIPPSIVMVVYAAATDVSVGRMFLAGVFPGLLAGLMLMVAIYVVARIKNLPAQPWAGWGEVFDSARDAVLGADADRDHPRRYLWRHLHADRGGRGGSRLRVPDREFRLPRHGAVQGRAWATWSMIPLRALSVFWHRDTKHALFEAGKLTIMLLFIIANALILKHVLTEERLPQMITEAMLSAGLGPIAFLVVVNVLLLIGGQFMEPSGLLIIVAPLVFPIAIALGIDPIHLGIIMVVNMEIGMITPPVGLNLFVTAGVAQMSVTSVIKAALPWVAIMFLFLIIVTYVPAVSTWLPTTLMGPEVITR